MNFIANIAFLFTIHLTIKSKKTMNISRQKYIDRLIAHKHNNRIKIITGIRRCGKSYLLFNLFKKHLIESGVKQSHIIEIQLENRLNKDLRNPDNCLKYIISKIKDNNQYYLLIDEIQLMLEFEDVLNSCLLIDNLDTYVTGSNSKFLSKDIITEFRGRGDELYLRPLSFNEFYQIRQDTSFEKAWNEYITYGGLPYCVLLNNHEEKDEYLKKLFTEVYLKDILERNHIQGEYAFEQLLNIISSGIGSLTNLRKLENTYKSEINLSISVNTISHYIECLEDAFMIEKVERYDVKGRKYISTQQKYYFTDLGLRNARLNFRQFEETHLMENAIYNELKDRGFSIDIGIVEINERQNNGKYIRKQTEIDFVCNKGAERIYVQSSFALPSIEKEQQEKRSLNNVYDSFRKIVIVKEDILTRKDSNGIITMGLKDFITNKNSLDEI